MEQLIQWNLSKLNTLGTTEKVHFREVFRLGGSICTANIKRTGLENTSSLERAPDYRVFGL
jgi:predicted nucleic acid binding AN1-type Zn finger protein